MWCVMDENTPGLLVFGCECELIFLGSMIERKKLPRFHTNGQKTVLIPKAYDLTPTTFTGPLLDLSKFIIYFFP